MSDIGTAYVNIVPKAEGIKGMLTKQFSSAGESAGQAGGTSLVGKMKGLVAGAAIGATIIAGIKKSVGEGAALEQSLGGIETLFKNSADTVIDNASRAYKTAGVSANEYMENVTSFSAGLIKSLNGDTAKAAKIADTAMIDMSDNANKMGTDITSIQNAYQGFAKQNYTMLDNLKLGYGGTKSEMERLLADAEQLSGKKYDISNLSDVYEAIHVIQGELGITGTTAEEAASTISGSFASMQAAFSDFMGNLALGRDIGPSMKALVSSAVTFLVGNLLPAIGNIMKGLPKAVSAGIQAAAKYLPKDMGSALDLALSKVEEKLPDFLNKGAELAIKIGTGILENLPGALEGIEGALAKVDASMDKLYPAFEKAGVKMVSQLAASLVKNAPKIVVALMRLQTRISLHLAKLGIMGLKYGLALVKELGKGIANAANGAISKAKAFASKVLSPITNLVNKIKGYFPLSIGKLFSNLKLPHISVSGGKPPYGIAGLGSLPKFSVSWYAKGGILTNPTLFGGGEAGDEAIVPLDPFWDKLDKTLGRGATINNTFNINGAEDGEQVANIICRKLELEMRSL